MESEKNFWRVKSITRNYEKVQFKDYNDVLVYVKDKIEDPELVYLRIKKHTKPNGNGNGKNGHRD